LVVPASPSDRSPRLTRSKVVTIWRTPMNQCGPPVKPERAGIRPRPGR
jgi:hypothetical protein